MSQPVPKPTDPRFMPPTPFSRLIATHAISVCGDACVAASLAGSLFFAQPSESARGDILLYLLLTMAPFAVVAPVMGPALDRIKGGRRLMVALSIAGRAVLCLAMAQFITQPSPKGLLIYPLAFGVLVLQKTYSVARSALLPALVEDENEFVRANSRLALISLLASLVGGAPAFGIQAALGADWSLYLAMIVFGIGTVVATKIPKTSIVQDPQEVQAEVEELHQWSILLGASLIAVARAAVGFTVFFAAFAFKDDKVALGFFAFSYGCGSFLGNIGAPKLRDRFKEETVIAAALVTTACLVAFGGLVGGTFGVAISGLGVAVGAAGGRLGFDSLLQRDGPDAARGRAFAKFETRFQVAWVLGALVGLIPLTQQAGLLGLAAILIFAAVSYVAALRSARGRVYRTTIRPKIVDDAFGRAKSGFAERRTRTRGGRRKTAAADRAAKEDWEARGEVEPPARRRAPRAKGPTDPRAS